ncbi:MAG: phosphoribosylformylglycinamidine cyclo-ligase [Synergistaceae bacterium]|jgi:phosphoribosylformylglycinamidine cyclo-ligase|nr:phosphoribosylformylglycinamidine cyclo-ligase [Synergistaceae bacterium]
MTGPFSPSFSYRDAGVDVDEANRSIEEIRKAADSTRRPEVLGSVGGFGGLFALDASRYREPVLVSGTDGVGTKLQVAFMMGRHDTIGQDVVAMCVNDVLVQGAEPLFFLDYLAVGKLNPSQVGEIVRGVAAACRESGCALIGGETAEMPGFYRTGEYDIAGFCVGVAERERLLPRADIAPGDVLIGVASSGLHSNGFSLVRKICFDHKKMTAETIVPELGTPLGTELLKPTRLYPKLVLPLLSGISAIPAMSIISVKGMVHITGGGFYENIPRILPKGTAVRVDPKTWTIPPIFTLLQQWGNVTDAEMFRTFNMGIGLILVVSAGQASSLIAELRARGEDAREIGVVIAGDGAVYIEGVTR